MQARAVLKRSCKIEIHILPMHNHIACDICFACTIYVCCGGHIHFDLATPYIDLGVRFMFRKTTYVIAFPIMVLFQYAVTLLYSYT